MLYAVVVCGIAGVITAGGAASLELVRAMCALQAHRGPDGEGVWRAPSGVAALGHRRLSIIDLSQLANQPMVHEPSGVALTYNGEVYNFVELRQSLESDGYRFISNSDTEVVLAAYLRWGKACTARFNGMFAFAIWDPRDSSLFCARDRFGEKPFYYALAGNAFVFASEAKAVTLAASVDRSVDADVLGAYGEHGSTALDASERTLLRGVRQLLPGHTLSVRVANGRVELGEALAYFEIDLNKRHPYGRDDGRQAAETLAELLEDSVRLRLRSDVPVGSCLSGGVGLLHDRRVDEEA